MFGLVNSLVRPLLTVLTCPLIVITLGLFTLVINAVMLMLTGWLSESWDLGFSVTGFWPAFWGSAGRSRSGHRTQLEPPALADHQFCRSSRGGFMEHCKMAPSLTHGRWT